jgi:lipid-binding SYLF domain-containing protein
MKTNMIAAALTVALGLAGGTAFAADAAKQAEVKKATDAALQKFYKARPEIKKEVDGSPGYAVFTSYGMSFGLGGAGGSGVAHDKGGKTTYMGMAQASAGPQVGISQNEVLIVFKSPKAYNDFVEKGWEFGAQGSVSAGAGGKGVGGGEGDQVINDAKVYTYTKNGVEVGGGLTGTKFWKTKELN